MKKQNTKELTRNDLKFKQLLKDVKIERIKTGKDQKFLSDKRLTLAISRIPNIKKFLIDSDIKEDKL